MTGITHDDYQYSEDDIRELARSIEPHDFDRIAPAAMVWNSILAEIEVETASSEAVARRKARSWFGSSRTLLAVAAATLLIVGIVGAVVVRDDDAGSLQELAVASMSDVDLPVPTDETALATVVCSDERCTVDVDLTDVPDAGDGADLELWVINGDVTDMYSLGFVTESTGSFELPFGVTAADYPIVDISVEPRDGDAAHSGQSVLRGVFAAA